MAHLYISCVGGGTFGGYFSINSGPEMLAKDGDVIELEQGLHVFVYNTVSISERKKGFNEADSSLLNSLYSKGSDYNTAGDDYIVNKNNSSFSISFFVQENDVVNLTVYSDINDHVYSLPKFIKGKQ